MRKMRTGRRGQGARKLRHQEVIKKAAASVDRRPREDASATLALREVSAPDKDAFVFW